MMNERIRELITQATTEEHDGFLYFDKKKFAELIVKDCASICELNGQSYKHSFTPAKAKLAESTSVYCLSLIHI
jgi:hypothetical protein